MTPGQPPREIEREIIDRLARIETKQEILDAKLTDIKALEVRVSSLESDRDKIAGGQKVIGFLCGVCGVAAGCLCTLLAGGWLR